MIQSLQSLRFVFVMLVVFSHIIGKSFDFGGECGVSFFFILSGFILSYVYGNYVTDKQFSTSRLLKKQLMKFYPLHLVTFCIMIVLDARLGHFFEWYRWLPNLLLLQSWIPDDSFFFVANGSSWFLSDMLFFYAVFALAFRLLIQMPMKRLACLIVFLLIGYFILAFSIPLWKVNAVLYASPVTRLIDFCMGILLYRFYASDKGRRLSEGLHQTPATVITTLQLTMLLAVVLSFFVYENISLRLRCASLFWLILPVFIFVFVVTDNVTKILHQRWMLWLGSLTFEIYLTHWIVLRIFWSVLASLGFDVEARYSLWVIGVTVLIIVFVAYMTKSLFTLPVTQYLQKRV